MHLGTGFLIAPNLFATAAHVVVDKENDGNRKRKKLVVHFNVNGSIEKSQKVKVIDTEFPPLYIQ